MTSLLTDNLFPRSDNIESVRRLRVNNNGPAPSVHPVSSLPLGAIRLNDIDVKSGPPDMTYIEPITAAGSRTYGELPEVPVPMAASTYLKSDLPNRIDYSYKGIRIDSEPSRMHHNSPEFMERQRRVFDHSELNPYTGQRVDYYRQLPPEETTDRRLPREALENVNLRMVALQGYDHTKPKPTRKETLSTFQPDKSHVEASNYMRRMSELHERAVRDVSLNQSGERPTWIREHQRAYGYNGYHDMSRYVPDLPATLRADMQVMKPSSDQVNNPEPKNELLVRGAYRTDAKVAHTGQVDYRTHAKSSNDKPMYTAGEQNRVADGTHRGDIEDQGFQPGPMGLDAAGVRTGSIAALHRRKGLDTGTVLTDRRVQGNLVPFGADMSSGATEQIFQQYLEGRAPDREGVQGVLGQGMSVRSMQEFSGSLPPSLSTLTDMNTQLRDDIPADLFLSYPGSMNIGELPANHEGVVDRPTQTRMDMSGPLGAELAMNRGSSVDRGHAITGNNTHVVPYRVQTAVDGKTYFNNAAADSMGGLNVANSTHDKAQRFSDVYTQKAATMRAPMSVQGAAGSGAVGFAMGSDTRGDLSGKRATTGNVSATTYLHGGGEGSAHRTEGIFNRESFAGSYYGDRTTVSDLNARKQQTSKFAM